VVDPLTGKGTERQAHDGDMTTVAVSPDGKYLIAGGEDRAVSVWEVGTMKRLAQWTAADGPITDVAFAPDGKTVAIGDAKGVVQVWDLAAVLAELARLGFAPE
jgi:WD40 repeat protein